MADRKFWDRSQGYGSLSIWTRYHRDGLQFQDKFTPTDCSCKPEWNGSAITIGGGYVWKDLYNFAATHNQVVVGGGDPVRQAIPLKQTSFEERC